MSKLKSVFLTLFLFLIFVSPLSSALARDILYTSYNIWFEPGKEKGLWCINYKSGSMIPAGSKVREVKLSRGAITFTTFDDGQQYIVKFNKKFHPGKTIQDYSNLMFTDKNFAELTDGLTAKEVEAIKKGVIVIGMSKRAVVTSYGYPPEHRTPTVEADMWTYWMNRFRTKNFHFNDNGETIHPPKKGDQL